ncbi:hypothetical protein OL229_13875 [Neisseriaceae bacterium JH1-16]|nr:hypothetical protein [Neisseriaceae bacterium JH1-16]
MQPKLGQADVNTMSRPQLRQALEQWFAACPAGATLACNHHYELLIDALDGELPPNISHRLDLSLLGPSFQQSVSADHAVPGQAWHHALHDARAFLAAWQALPEEEKAFSPPS